MIAKSLSEWYVLDWHFLSSKKHFQIFIVLPQFKKFTFSEMILRVNSECVG